MSFDVMALPGSAAFAMFLTALFMLLNAFFSGLSAKCGSYS
jgi:hypothetical protein